MNFQGMSHGPCVRQWNWETMFMCVGQADFKNHCIFQDTEVAEHRVECISLSKDGRRHLCWNFHVKQEG